MKTAYAVAAAMILSVTVAFGAEEPACSGEVWVIRKSQIIEDGTIAGFMGAVAAQLAWYRANGVTDNDIVAGPVFGAAGAAGLSTAETLVVTVHINSPGARTAVLPYGNDAWNTFVELFRANSEIVEETRLCKSAF